MGFRVMNIARLNAKSVETGRRAVSVLCNLPIGDVADRKFLPTGGERKVRSQIHKGATFNKWSFNVKSDQFS